MLEGPGTKTTRSVWMLFCSPRASSPLAAPVWSIEVGDEPKSGRTALPIAQFDQPALAREDLSRQLAAVFAGHRSLDALDDG